MNCKLDSSARMDRPTLEELQGFLASVPDRLYQGKESGSELLESVAWMRESGLDNSRHVQVLHRAKQKTASLDAIDSLSKASKYPGSTSLETSSNSIITAT